MKKQTILVLFFLYIVISQAEIIDQGFVFYNGSYLESPYNVLVRDLSIYINDVQVTRQLELQDENTFYFPYEPGLPPESVWDLELEDALYLKEPDSGVPYILAAVEYYYSYFDYDEAAEKAIDYVRRLPFVRSYERTDSGEWQLVTRQGEKRYVSVTGGIFQKHNRIWGPNGEGPLTRSDLEEILAEEAEMYRDRLGRGDLLIFYEEGTFRLYPGIKAVNVLNTITALFDNGNLSNEQKAAELIAFGIAPRTDPELADGFVANYQNRPQLTRRIEELNRDAADLYGQEVIRPLERDRDLKNIELKRNLSSDGNRSRTTSYSPDNGTVYFGCAYTYDSAFSLYETERNQVIARLVDQDFDGAYVEFKDTAYDSLCETLTYDNLKSMTYADFLYWTSHGSPSGEGNGLSLIYMKTEQQILDWCQQDTTLINTVEVICETVSGDTLYPWAARANSSWPATYWNATLTQSKAITILSNCFSYENGWVAATGGGVAFGYEQSCTQGNNQTNNQELLDRMNGTIGDGEFRPASIAYANMPGYPAGFNLWPADAMITLCPGVDYYYPEDESLVPPSGTGNFDVDTWVMDFSPPDQALTFETFGEVEISNISWESDTRDQVNRIEYEWDGEGFFIVKVDVHHDKFNSWGFDTVPYHNLDWDGIAPNTEDGEFIFESGSNIDVALCIDRSGSMAGDKIEQAKNASNQFIALLRKFDDLAVISFSDYATVEFAIETIMGVSTKLEAQTAVNEIETGGYTSIGGGMALSQLQLDQVTFADYPQAMILLSDGAENTSPWVGDVLPTIPENTDIYTIGLGSGADAVQLTEIASETDGLYFFSPGPEGLMNIFDSILSKVTGKQQIASDSGTIPPEGGENNHTVQVDPSVKQFQVAVMWRNPSFFLDLTLFDPDDNEIDPEEAEINPLILYDAFQTIAFYKVSFPEPGEWTINVSGDAAPEAQEYAVSATGYADVTMEFFFGMWRYIEQDTIWAFVGLKEGTTPVTGASVIGEVLAPSGRIEIQRDDADPYEGEIANLIEYRTDEITFYDDGNHHDLEADDGLYGAAYGNTSVVGNYTFSVIATGIAPSAGQFTRHALRTVFVQEAPEYESDYDEVDFGDVIETITETFTITITNNGPEGAADLEMTEMMTDNPVFTIDQDNMIIEQGESGDMTFAFTPFTIGLHEGTMSCQTNDPVFPIVEIPLWGNCLAAPEYNVWPTSLTELLDTGEQSIARVYLNNLSETTTCRYWAEQVISHTNIVINEIFLGTPDWIELYNGTAAPVNLVDMSLTWTATNDYDDMISLPDFELQPDSYVVITDSSQPSDSTHLNMGGNIYWASNAGGSCRLVEDGEEIDFMRFGGSDVGSSFWTETEPLPIPSSAADKTLGRDVLSIDTNSSRDWDIQDKSEAEENYGSESRNRISWFYTYDYADSIAPGETDTISVLFNAYGLPAGTYNGSLIIHTNNPFLPDTTVTVQLDVTGAADISVSEDTVDLDSSYVSYPVTRMFYVTNEGVEQLDITDITTDLTVFDTDFTSMSLGVWESDSLLITFTPDDAGVYTDTLRIFSNDPDESPYKIVLMGTGVHPGQIGTDPAAVTQNMPADAEYMQELSVINNGLGELRFEAHAENDWSGRFGEIPFEPVTVFVLDSWGTDYNTATWVYLNENFDDIVIDFTTLNDSDITYEEIAATEADVLLISDAWRETQSYGEFSQSEIDAIILYVNEGHGLIITAGTFNGYRVPAHNQLTPLVGLDPAQFYEWNDGSSYLGGDYTEINLLYPEHPILYNLTDPYEPGTLKSCVPDTRSWDDGIIEAQVIARSSNNEAVITTYMDRVFISNIPESNSNDDDINLLHNAILYAGNRAVKWLRIDYENNTVLPSSSGIVELTFDSIDLESGTYNANLVISSNDPVTPTTVVPVTLNIGDYILSPAAVVMSIDGNSISISWEAVVGAGQYAVYSASEPSGPYSEEMGGIYTYPGDRVVWTKEFSTIENKMFFYVKAMSE